MSWFAQNQPWLDRAREAWTPRSAEPFTVRVWLSSPIAWTADGVMLDGLLQRIVVERETGLPADDVFAECPRELDVEIQIPIADVTIAGLPIACASWGMPPAIAVESLRWRRKRARPEAMPGDRLLVAGGPFKSHNIPVQTLVTPWLDFHVVGDRERVQSLMVGAVALGRGFASGLGTIIGVEYLPDPEQRALMHAGRPMRALPLGEGCPPLIDGVVAERATRAPYWKGRGRALCAVPVNRGFAHVFLYVDGRDAASVQWGLKNWPGFDYESGEITPDEHPHDDVQLYTSAEQALDCANGEIDYSALPQAKSLDAVKGHP